VRKELMLVVVCVRRGECDRATGGKVKGLVLWCDYLLVAFGRSFGFDSSLFAINRFRAACDPQKQPQLTEMVGNQAMGSITLFSDGRVGNCTFSPELLPD
jgi:hypothetical protein